MKILVLGSINIDYNYSVKRITAPKETRASLAMHAYPGGKGMNQAVALARAGMDVKLAGMIGEDGQDILDEITAAGVDTSMVRMVEDRTGHAIIQVDDVGQNAILLYSGANHKIDKDYVDEVLADYEAGDILLLQNEISCLPYILEQAKKKELFVVLNPSPITQELLDCDLSNINMFCLNEMEGRALTGFVQPGDIMIRLQELYPNSEVVFTLGAQGAFYKRAGKQYYQPAIKVSTVDCTAAGDIFEGYFLAAYLQNQTPQEALKYASYAASLSILKRGAATTAAPLAEDVGIFMESKEK